MLSGAVGLSNGRSLTNDPPRCMHGPTNAVSMANLGELMAGLRLDGIYIGTRKGPLDVDYW